jgi:hypothetical protein
MKDNNYAPGLPEEEINKLVKEMSDPDLVPNPNNFPDDRDGNLNNKVGKIVNELVEVIKKEKINAFQAGLEEGKRLRK